MWPLLLLLLLFFFSSYSTSSDYEWTCPPSWHLFSFNGTVVCHKLFQEDFLIFEDAEFFCDSKNATLTSIRTEEELLFLNDLMRIGWRIPQEDYPSDSVWISKKNPIQSDEEMPNRKYKTRECSVLTPSYIFKNYSSIHKVPCDFSVFAKKWQMNRNLPLRHVLCSKDVSFLSKVSRNVCERGWFLFQNKSCHKLLNIAVSSMKGAEILCKAEEATVSTIETFEKKEFIYNMATSGWSLTKDLPHLPNLLWIGLKKSQGASEHFWSNGAKFDENMVSEKQWKDLEGECATMDFGKDKKGRNGGINFNNCDRNRARNSDMKREALFQIICDKEFRKKGIYSHQNEEEKKICGIGWHKTGEKCYRSVRIGVSSFDGARAICEGFGAKLASIRTKEELQFISDVTQREWLILGWTEVYGGAWVDLKKNLKTGKWLWNGEMPMNDMGNVSLNPEHYRFTGESYLKVISGNSEIDSRLECSMFIYYRYLQNATSYFEEMPCDIAIYENIWSPTHILCEKDYNQIDDNKKISLCEDHWSFFEENYSCVKVFMGEPISQGDAQQKCENFSANLVTVKNDEKNEFVLGLIHKAWHSGYDFSWIGLKKIEDKWLWTDGETLVDFRYADSKRKFDSENCSAMNLEGKFVSRKCEMDVSAPGSFVCEKPGILFQDAKSVEDKMFLYLAILGIIFTILFSVLFIIFFCKRHRNKAGNQKEMEGLLAENSLDYLASSFEFNRDFEISMNSLEFMHELGHGHFGEVWKAILEHPQNPKRHLEVAVKKSKDSDDIEQNEALCTEIKLMSQLGTHPNVISCIGAVTSQSQYFLILELCSRGNFKDFLVEKKELSEEELIRFSFQLANGMTFLSNLPCIHRDLAARNILLTEGNLCKISDFGLAKTENYYRGVSSRCLPLRWMAPEAIQSRRFTISSDVWSFGILLFEIISGGRTPYSEIPHSEVISAIVGGAKNETKNYSCPTEIDSLIHECWKSDPQLRPTFCTINSILRKLYFSLYPQEYQKLRKDLSQHDKELKNIEKWRRRPSAANNCWSP